MKKGTLLITDADVFFSALTFYLLAAAIFIFQFNLRILYVKKEMVVHNNYFYYQNNI